MANNFCQNCGSALVNENGRLVCPACGSVFGVNWDKDDVARADEATKEERAQAWVDRVQKTAETRAALQMQAQQQQAARDRQKALLPMKRMLLVMGIMFAGFFLFRIITCGAALGLSQTVLSNRKGTATTTTVEAYVGIKGKDLIKDKDYLINALGSGHYYAKYESPKETTFFDPMRDGKLTGEPQYVESYVARAKTYSDFYMIFMLTYTVEDSDETVTTYYPVAIRGLMRDDSGKMSPNYTAGYAVGENGTSSGYMDLDALITDVLGAKEYVGYDKVVVPQEVLDEVFTKG